MKSDSYPRYIRSEMYREFLNGSKKKVSNQNGSNMIKIKLYHCVKHFNFIAGIRQRNPIHCFFFVHKKRTFHDIGARISYRPAIIVILYFIVDSELILFLIE